jgi:hypothetical protein
MLRDYRSLAQPGSAGPQFGFDGVLSLEIAVGGESIAQDVETNGDHGTPTCTRPRSNCNFRLKEGIATCEAELELGVPGADPVPWGGEVQKLRLFCFLFVP